MRIKKKSFQIKFNRKEKKYPENGALKVIKKFAILPIIMDGVFIWLEHLEKHYMYNSSAGRHGKWEFRHKNVIVKEEEGFNQINKKGQKHGPWRGRYDNGNVYMDWHSINGISQGLSRTYTLNGEFRHIYNVEKNEVEGEVIYYEKIRPQ